MVHDPREAFVSAVKRIDPIFKRGDLKTFWPHLRALIRIAPHRPDLSRKKSHYLVSLAARSLRHGNPQAAAKFLDYADERVDPDHLTAYFVEERRRWREQVERALHIGTSGPTQSKP